MGRRSNLVGQVEELRREPGLVEERTGLHELEFIEVRRHWFEQEAAHDTEGTVNVLNLVEGDEVEIVSPTDAFAPYAIHYAETFIVPAAVGPVRHPPDAELPERALRNREGVRAGNAHQRQLSAGRRSAQQTDN